MSFNDIKERCRKLWHTEKAHNIIVFVIFVVIAAMFWLLTALNDTVQRSFEVEVEIIGVPSEVTMLSTTPVKVNVAVQSKGRSFVKYDFGSDPSLNVNFKDFASMAENHLVIDEQRLKSLIANQFGEGAELISSRPDSIVLLFTTLPPTKMPVRLNIDAKADVQHTIVGSPKLSQDSVWVYSSEPLPANFVAVQSKRVSLTNLSADQNVGVKLEVPAGMKVEPSEISVSLKVSPLVSKKTIMPITVINLPDDNVTMMTFPAQVEIDYLVPKDMYDTTLPGVQAVVDYNDIDSVTTALPIKIVNLPDFVEPYTMQCTPDTAEYRLILK